MFRANWPAQFTVPIPRGETRGGPIDASGFAVLYVFAKAWTGLARLDPHTSSLVSAADCGGRMQRQLASRHRYHAIVQEERCIARPTFDSPEREILFPGE